MTDAPQYKFNKAIIDMDPLIYRCGFSVETYDKETEIVTCEPLQNAIYNLNSMMRKILETCGTREYEAYLTSTDRSNFRFDLFPAYKANRSGARKPVYYEELRHHAKRQWLAEVVRNEEADDRCSIRHCDHNPIGFDKEVYNSIVCSFDKDFNNIPGWHYNFVKNEVYYVEEIQALRNFYLQILTGDTSDGIPRIKKGWRQKKVEEAIEKALTEEEMYNIIHKEIKDLKKKREDFICLAPYNMNIEEEIVARGQLVWLRRVNNEMWYPGFNVGEEKVNE